MVTREQFEHTAEAAKKSGKPIRVAVARLGRIHEADIPTERILRVFDNGVVFDADYFGRQTELCDNIRLFNEMQEVKIA